jgi:hypothetical protein
MKIYKKGISLSVTELNALQNIIQCGIHNAQYSGCSAERFELLSSIKKRLSESMIK